MELNIFCWQRDKNVAQRYRLSGKCRIQIIIGDGAYFLYVSKE